MDVEMARLSMSKDSRFGAEHFSDILTLIINYSLLDPNFAINLMKNCEKNDNNERYNKLICDNRFLLESLWLRYISNELPKTKNFDELKILYKDKIRKYNLTLQEVIEKGKDESLLGNDIAYKNAKAVEYIWYYDDKLSDKNFKDVVYLDQFQRPNFQSNALIRAIHTINNDKVEILIKYGANVNIEMFGKLTPLMYAAKLNINPNWAGDVILIVKMLLNAGANVNIVNDQGETAYDLAIKNKNIVVANTIKEFSKK